MDFPMLKKEEYLPDSDSITVRLDLVYGVCDEHTHDFIEMAYIMSGSGTHRIGGDEYRVQKGDLFFIDPQTVHGFHADTAIGPLAVYNCLFKPEFIDGSLSQSEEFLDSAYSLFFSSVLSDNRFGGFIKLSGAPAFETYFVEMARECKGKQEGYLSVVKSYLTLLIVKAFRLFRKTLPDGASLSPVRRQLVDDIIGYINKNYNKSLSLGELATRTFLSPAYFSRVFKEYTSQTLTQFIQAQRIRVACDLLRDTDMSVDDIATEVGYQDIKFFYELFQRTAGTTPGHYRKAQQDTPKQ